MNWKFWQWRKPALAPVAPVIPLPEPPPVNLVKPPPAAKKDDNRDRMNPETKREWTKRLRSRRYEQGTDALKTRNDHEKSRYCCLGVLCEIAVEDGIIAPPDKRPSGRYEYDGDVSTPSERVVKWAGMPSENPVVWYDKEGRNASLAELNDDGVPFDEIADLIDEQL